jgi:hypothetical protein
MSVNRTVSKEKRVLLIVNCLAEHGDQRLRFLYQFIESAGVETARRLLERHYRQISVLRDREATHAGFLDRLKTLAEDKTIDAVDLFLQLHGEPGKVRFHDHWVSTMRLREEIKRAAGRDCLRLVYNTSCYGDTHSDDLLKAGFKVSVGARKVNASAAAEFPIFCRQWPGAGSSKPLPVKELILKADLPKPRQVQDQLAGRYFSDVDSKKVVRGNGAVTIDMMP